MKLWIPMLILFLGVLSLCVWDSIYTNMVFNNLIKKSEMIDSSLQTKSITDEEIQNEILGLNEYWTEKMDTLCV